MEAMKGRLANQYYMKAEEAWALMEEWESIVPIMCLQKKKKCLQAAFDDFLVLYRTKIWCLDNVLVLCFLSLSLSLSLSVISNFFQEPLFPKKWIVLLGKGGLPEEFFRVKCLL